MYLCKYYFRELFPEGKCQHIMTNFLNRPCVYKARPNQLYCHAHTQFIERKNEIFNVVLDILPKDVCGIVMKYWN